LVFGAKTPVGTDAAARMARADAAVHRGWHGGGGGFNSTLPSRPSLSASAGIGRAFGLTG